MSFKFNPFTSKLDIVGSSGGTTINFADNETPSGSGTTFTLAQTPNPTTSLCLYRGGGLLQQGVGKDYTLSGVTITLGVTLDSREVLLANYRY